MIRSANRPYLIHIETKRNWNSLNDNDTKSRVDKYLQSIKTHPLGVAVSISLLTDFISGSSRLSTQYLLSTHLGVEKKKKTRRLFPNTTLDREKKKSHSNLARSNPIRDEISRRVMNRCCRIKHLISHFTCLCFGQGSQSAGRVRSISGQTMSPPAICRLQPVCRQPQLSHCTGCNCTLFGQLSANIIRASRIPQDGISYRIERQFAACDVRKTENLRLWRGVGKEFDLNQRWCWKKIAQLVLYI